MSYQNINQYNYNKWYLRQANYVRDICLASDAKDYNQEVVFSPYLIAQTYGNRLPVYLDLDNSGTTQQLNLTWKNYQESNLLVSLNYSGNSGEDLSCFSADSNCNIGLTGIDNGLVDQMTGETLYYTNALFDDAYKFDRMYVDRRMKYHQVTGHTWSPNEIFSGVSAYTLYEVISKTGTTVGYYNQLYGGFYQGFFRLFGYDYDILPERMHRGWTAEFLLKPRQFHEYIPATGETTLNEYYPNNKNFFFYMGTRAEDKFWHHADGQNSGDTGYTRVTQSLADCLYTCECSATTSTYSGCVSVYPMTATTLSGGTCPSCGCTPPVIIQEEDRNVWYDSMSNAIGVKFSGDPANPKICVRLLRFTGHCETTGSCETTGITYVTGYTIDEYCSPEGIFDICSGTTYSDIEHWVMVDVTWKRNMWMDICDLEYRGGLGLITETVYWDSLANKSVNLISPPITHDQLTPATKEIVQLNEAWLLEEYYRLGKLQVFVNGKLFFVVPNVEEIIPRALNTEKERQVGVPFNMSWGGGTQGLHENLTFTGCPTSLTGNIYQQDPENFPENILSGTTLSGLTTNILLEQNFGGTFEGGISQFRFYIDPLSVPEVKHNYLLLKDKFDLLNPDCPNCVITECDFLYTFTRVSEDVYSVTFTSENYDGDTGYVLYLPNDETTTYDLGAQTIPFTYLSDDGTGQGKYFIYFSGTDVTCEVNVNQDNPVNIELYGYFFPGSVGAGFEAYSDEPVDTDVTINFTAIFDTTTGDTLNVTSGVTIYSGMSSGFTQLFISANYDELTQSMSYSGVTISDSGTSYTFIASTGYTFNASPTPTNTPTQTPTPTVTTTQTPTVTITSSETPTPTSTLTQTPTPTETVTPTVSLSETPTQTPTETITPTPTETITPTPTETVTPTVSLSETPTQTPSQTVTPTVSVSDTPTPTPTETVTPTVSLSETLTPTPTETVTPTVSLSETPTSTPTETVTPTVSLSETPTQTPSQTVTPTVSLSETPMVSPSPTITPTITSTETPTSTPTLTPTSTPLPIVESGLILNWDIQNLSSYSGSGNTITDLQGNSNGTLTGTISYTQGTPSSGIANYLDVEGSSSEYIVSSTNLNSKLSPANTGTDISYFLWVYPTGNGIIINEQGTTTPQTSWHDSQIEIVSGQLKYRLWQLSSPFVTSSTSLTLNTWHYVGLTYSGTTLIAYLDGNNVGSTSFSRLTPYNDGGVGLHYSLGATDSVTNMGDGNGATFRFGALHIYNRGLTSSEVSQNYDNTKGNYTPPASPTPTATPTETITPTVSPTSVVGSPILLLDGANATSSTWTDTSGQGNNVTLYNSPTISTDNGGYVSLNGTNQYGTAPSGFDDFTNGITVLAFVDFNGVSTWERIIDFGNGEASDNIILNRESSTNNLWFEIRQGSTQAFTYSLTNGITNNDWGFYGARLDGSTYKVFTQSTSDVGSTSALPNNITRSSNLIGDSNWAADAFFDGKMGVIAIYDYALTDSEINSFYEYYRGRYSLSPLPYVTPTPTASVTPTITPTVTP